MLICDPSFEQTLINTFYYSYYSTEIRYKYLLCGYNHDDKYLKKVGEITYCIHFCHNIRKVLYFLTFQ